MPASGDYGRKWSSNLGLDEMSELFSQAPPRIDPMSNILVARGHCASLQIQHIFPAQISGRGDNEPQFLRDRGIELSKDHL